MSGGSTKAAVIKNSRIWRRSNHLNPAAPADSAAWAPAASARPPTWAASRSAPTLCHLVQSLDGVTGPGGSRLEGIVIREALGVHALDQPERVIAAAGDGVEQLVQLFEGETGRVHPRNL